MKELSREERKRGRRVGLVPTMGALHEGHLSLVSRARTECDTVVLSIFINLHQFGPSEDYDRYPRDLSRDAGLAAGAGVGILFCPGPAEIYVPGHATWIEVERLGEVMCGPRRPGHFRAVATVVAKLFGIVRPRVAYFGEKDAQQLRIIRRMARDLHQEVAVVGCRTVREKDGLALSSRNAYLTPGERRAAPVLYRALVEAQAKSRAGEKDARRLVEQIRATLETEPLVRVDYVEAVDDETLEPVTTIERRTLLGVAAYLGKSRLIDNILIDC